MTDQAKLDSEQAKRDLIKEVQQIGKLWDGIAARDAIIFTKNPDNLERKAQAQISVYGAEMATNVAERVVELIHKYWPV